MRSYQEYSAYQSQQLIKLCSEGSSFYGYYHITVVWCWIFKKLIRCKFSKHLIRAEGRYIRCSKWTPLFETIDLSYLWEANKHFNPWGVKKIRSLYLGSNSLLNWRFYVTPPPPEDLFAFKCLNTNTMITFFSQEYSRNSTMRKNKQNGNQNCR